MAELVMLRVHRLVRKPFHSYQGISSPMKTISTSLQLLGPFLLQGHSVATSLGPSTQHIKLGTNPTQRVHQTQGVPPCPSLGLCQQMAAKPQPKNLSGPELHKYLWAERKPALGWVFFYSYLLFCRQPEMRPSRSMQSLLSKMPQICIK